MACYRLALLNLHGAEGVVINQTKGLQYATMAAKDQFPDSIFLLGEAYYQGLHGLKPDRTKGLQYLQQGFQLGHAGCLKSLCNYYGCNAMNGMTSEGLLALQTNSVNLEYELSQYTRIDSSGRLIPRARRSFLR